MLRLYVKDNTSGQIHEYGANKHDALILQDDGSLHYENMQCCVGTKFQKEGYSFCLEDGTIPEWDLEHGVEPYIDIGGEYYSKPTTNADRIRSMTDEELATFISEITNCETNTECKQHCYGCEIAYCDYRMCLKWLKQPAEGE